MKYSSEWYPFPLTDRNGRIEYESIWAVNKNWWQRSVSASESSESSECMPCMACISIADYLRTQWMANNTWERSPVYNKQWLPQEIVRFLRLPFDRPLLAKVTNFFEIDFYAKMLSISESLDLWISGPTLSSGNCCFFRYFTLSAKCEKHNNGSQSHRKNRWLTRLIRDWPTPALVDTSQHWPELQNRDTIRDRFRLRYLSIDCENAKYGHLRSIWDISVESTRDEQRDVSLKFACQKILASVNRFRFLKC